MAAGSRRLRVRIALIALALSGASACADSPFAPCEANTCFQDVQVLFDGNSMTRGLSNNPAPYPFPQQVRDRLELRPELWANVAISGQTTADMLLTAPEQIDRLYRPGLRGNYVVLWEGTNDLHFGATADEAHDRLLKYAQERRRAGFAVLILTLLPRRHDEEAGTARDLQFETERQALNARIRQEWPRIAHVVDVAADPRLNTMPESRRGEFFSDGVHLTTRGDSVVADHVEAALRQLVRR